LISYLQIMPLAMVDYEIALPGFLDDYLRTLQQSSSGSGTMVSLDCSLGTGAPKAIQALFIDISLPGRSRDTRVSPLHDVHACHTCDSAMRMTIYVHT